MEPTALPSGNLAPGSVAVLGIPWDDNSSFRRGCAQGPKAIRTALRSPAGNLCTEDGLDLGEDPRFLVLGDAAVDAGLAGVESIERAIAELLLRDARVLSLGGDHAISYPVIRAQAAAHPGLTVIQLDAHPDLYDELDGNRLSHACPFARIMEEGLVDRLIQVGIRTMNPHQRAQAERFDVEVIEMRGWSVDRLPKVDAPIYLSIDLDVLDPAHAPGVSHPEPGGMTVREMLALLRALPAPLVGADVTELNPTRDPQGLTAIVAAKIVKEVAGQMLGKAP